MRTLTSIVSGLTLLLITAGCGDGTLEIKTKSNGPAPASPTVVVEKPVVVREEPTTTKETKTSVTTPNGTTETRDTKVTH